MSQELFNYLANELGAIALETNLIDIKRIVMSEYDNISIERTDNDNEQDNERTDNDNE